MSLNACRGSNGDASGTQGGARWMNKAICPVCGKRITVTKSGHLRTHGTRRVQK